MLLLLLLHRYVASMYVYSDHRMILSTAQPPRPVIAKANELEGRNLIGRAGATKAEHQGEQYKGIKSSRIGATQNLSLVTECTVQAPALYIIKASPGKGLGMFATTNLQKGTRILAEKPFFSLAKSPKLSLSDPYAPNDISEAFDRLPVSEQFKYMELHCPERNDCSVLVKIYEANCYEMASGGCICVDASRINHSCLPNAHYSWNEGIERITVHAVMDIFKGEEITISYCSAIRTLKDRDRKLRPYVFTCRCPACRVDTYFGSMSQVRRQQMLDLDHEIADFQNDPSTAQAEYGHTDEESAILKILGLMDGEGLVYEKSLAYHDAAEWAWKRGLRVQALEYASKELDVDLCCVGGDSPTYKKTMSFFLKIYFGIDEL